MVTIYMTHSNPGMLGVDVEVVRMEPRKLNQFWPPAGWTIQLVNYEEDLEEVLHV